MKSIYPKLPKVKKPICIIGAGGIVHDAHLPAYKSSQFEIKAIYDIDINKADQLARKYNIPNVCQSMEELVEVGQRYDCVYDLALPAAAINDVLITIPDHSGVLIQKPMGEHLQQAKEILEICRSKDLIAGINFQLRHAPFILTAKNMVDEGIIGELHDIEVKVCTYTPWHLWDFLFQIPRVEILYHSIHYIDVIRYFLGDPLKIYAKTIKHPGTPQIASTRTHIMLDYGEMLRANIDTNHGHNFGSKKQESYIKLEGTKGAIKMKMGVLLNYPDGVPDQYEYFSHLEENPVWKEVSIKGTWFPDAFIGPMSGLMDKIHNPDFHYINSVDDAFRTMLCVEAAYNSSDRGGANIHPDQEF